MDQVSSFISRGTMTAKKTSSASSPALNGWETYIPFRWDCQVDKSKKTVDKKTPTAKKGTNLAVGLSRTKVQETKSDESE